MQYDLLNIMTPFLMKSVEKWVSTAKKKKKKKMIFEVGGLKGVMKSVFLPILMVSSAIEIIFGS